MNDENNENENIEEEMLEEQAELTDADRQDDEENNGFEADVMQDAEEALKDIKAAQSEAEDKPACGHDPDTLSALARERADFLNFKQRAAREQQSARDLGKREAIRAFLPALDAITRAKDAGDLDADSPFGKIAADFENALDKLGVSSYGKAGDVFDPKVHEALMNRDATDDDDIAQGEIKVDKVLEPGYKMNDDYFRTAKVMTVSKE